MFKIFIILFLSTLTLHNCLAYRVLRDDANNEELDTSVICKERPCSRIYRPLCVSVEGEQLTLPSRCHFNNMRCAAVNYSVKMGQGQPTVRVMYGGSC